MRFFNRIKEIDQYFSPALEPVDADGVIRNNKGLLYFAQPVAEQIKQRRILRQLAARERLHVLPGGLYTYEQFHLRDSIPLDWVVVK